MTDPGNSSDGESAPPTVVAPPPPGASHQCSFCASQLSPGAVYCVKCEKFQTFRDRVLSGIDFSAILSGLTALVPVLVLSFQVTKGALRSDSSQLKATVLKCTEATVTLLLSNDGTRAGALYDGKVTMKQPNGKDVSRFLEPPEGKPISIGPTSTSVYLMMLRSGSDTISDAMPPSDKCSYEVKLSIVASDGTRSLSTGECTCHD